MGIVTPYCSITDEEEFDEFQKQYDCLTDIDNVFDCLQDVGMIDIKRCPKRKDSFIFTESLSGHTCKLGVDKGMLYEREKLIGTYLQLDKRIRPLITVIFHFCKSHGLKKSIKLF